VEIALTGIRKEKR